jgi:hypothetical protein
MRTLFRGAFCASLALLIVSCGLLKKKGDEGDAAAEASTAEVADAAPTPPPAALANNEADIARFPDETKLDNVAATFARSYNVREAPPAGTLIAGLNKGTAVTQIASRDKYFLILFDDPAAAGQKKMGWVHGDAFNTNVITTIKCGPGDTALITGSEAPFCGKVCAADSDCPGGQNCKGQANKFTNGKAGAAVQVCTVFHAHDAGPGPSPVATDGGLSVVVKKDAGLVTTQDSGPAPGPTPVAGDIAAPPCAAGFTLVAKTNKCHRNCPGGPTAGQCTNAKSVCIKCDSQGGVKICADSRDACK